MNSTSYSESDGVSRASLWFALFGPAAAWTLSNLIDLFVSWHVCREPNATWASASASLRWGLALITFAGLAVAVAGIVISFRNWRRLTRRGELVHAEGKFRPEFMALAGLFVSVSFTAGLIWSAIPVFMTNLCSRSR